VRASNLSLVVAAAAAAAAAVDVVAGEEWRLE
jgi:hypothetical protein